MTLQLRLPLQAAPRLADKPFVTGSGSAEACARMFDSASWPCGALALVGPAGVGKSHLAAIWADRRGALPLEADPERSDVDLARLAEDVDRRLGDAAFEETLFHALNRAAQGRSGPLLITGRGAPAQWPCRLPDLRSRLNALPCAELFAPDDAQLRALLTALFRERSIRPGDDLLAYLLRRIERSAAGALAIVEALDDACRQGARLGRSLARTLLDGGDQTSDLFDEPQAEAAAEG